MSAWDVAGLVAAAFAGTGGCWLGIRAADRVNERYRERHGMYPIERLRARLWRR